MPLRIYRRSKTGPYWCRGTIAGTYIHESTRCRTRDQAVAYANRRETEILDRHAYGIERTITFAEAALDYLETGGEARFLDRILDYAGPDTLLSQIDNEWLTVAAIELFPNLAPASINRGLIGPVSAVYNRAAHDGRVPFRRFIKRKTPPGRTRWLTPSEAERLIDACMPYTAKIVVLLLGSGMRISEALRASVDDFYPETGQVWIGQTKNGFPRMVKLPQRARDKIIEDLPASGAVLRGRLGQPYTLDQNKTPGMHKAFKAAVERAELPGQVSPHTLRHTWATWYYAATRDYGGLLDLGGWRTANMAQRYRKIAPDTLPDELIKHGWDFTKLGRDLPEIPKQETPFRVIKGGRS